MSVVFNYNDNGSNNADGITSDSIIKLSNFSATMISWQYSYDSGMTWFNGAGSSFSLPDGTYNKSQIVVKEYDAFNNTTVSVMGSVSTMVQLEALNKINGSDSVAQIAIVGDLGEYVVAFYGQNNINGYDSIFVQKFNANGTKQGSMIQLEASGVMDGNYANPKITAVGTSGEYLVTFQGSDYDGDGSIFIQKFNADGTRSGTMVLLEAFGITFEDEQEPQIISIGNSGEYVVTFYGRDIDGDYSIFVQKFNADGITQGSMVRLEASGENSFDWSPRIATVGNSGEYVVAFYGNDSGGDESVFVQKFNADGTVAGLMVQLEGVTGANGRDILPQISSVGTSGKYVVTFYGMDSNGDASIFVQQFNSNGETLGSIVKIEAIGITNMDDYEPQITAIGSVGEYVVAFYGYEANGDSSVFVQKFNSDGTIQGSMVKLEAAGVEDSFDWSPRIAAVGNNGEYAVTFCGIDSGGDYSVFVQKFNSDGTIQGSMVQLEAISRMDGRDFYPQIAAIGSEGQYAVTFQGVDSDGDNSIFVQQFNSDGTVISNESIIVKTVKNNVPTFSVGTGFIDIKEELDGNVSSSGGLYGSIAGEFVAHDGKIIVIGTTEYEDNIYLIRYHEDGSIDTTFGTNGKVFIAFDGYSVNRAKEIIIQDDGKIVVVVQVDDGRTDFGLVRLEQDGSIDQSYGDKGYVTTNFGDDSFAFTAAMQSDGKIVVAGQARGQSHLEFALARYTKNGKLDTAFGDNGIQMDDIGDDYYSNIDDIAIDTDGKIYVLGFSENVGVVENVAIIARYTNTGWLDNSFSPPTGWKMGGSLEAGSKLIITTNWVVIAGYTHTDEGNKLAVARFDKEDGSYDRAWLVETPVEDSIALDMIFQSDGKFVLVGSTQNIGFMIRYNFDGTVDTTFGNNGSVFTEGNLNQVVVQDDGSILAMGLEDGAPLLGHYDSNGKIDVTFGADDTLMRPYVYNLAQAPIILNDHVEIFDKELDQQDNYQGAVLTLQRHGGANPDDLFSGAGIVVASSHGDIQINGKQLGIYTYNSGTLEIFFDKAITRLEINAVMQSIAYSNNNLESSPTIELDWIFDDGNSGAQGDGDGQIVGTMLLSLNHVPLSQNSNISFLRDEVYSFNLNDFLFNDADQNDSLSEVVILSLPQQGTLLLEDLEVEVGDKISSSDISAGKLQYRPITANDEHNFGFITYKVGDGWSYSRSYSLILNPENTTPTMQMDDATTLDVWSFDNTYHVWNDAAITADGAVITLGNDINDFILGRYFGNDLDASFGTDNPDGRNGMVKTDIDGETDKAYALAIQLDGKIIAAGQSDNMFSMVRYNADGSLDTSFGTNAQVQTVFEGVDDSIHDIVLQGDGKIVVVGRTYDDTLKEYHFALARYNSDGSLDTTFSGDGKNTTDLFDASNEIANAVGIQTDGKIIVGGHSAKDFTLVRYNSKGTLDTSFGTNGITTTDMTHNGIKELVIDSQNNIIAVGAYGGDFALVRYTSDGVLDTAFGSNGMVILDGYTNALYNGIGLQSDGKIIVVGNAQNNELYSSGSMIVVARYTIDGKLDRSFGINGIAELDGTANSVTIYDDDIIIAGSYFVKGSGGFGNPYGTPDETRMLLSYLDKNGYKTSLNKSVNENTTIGLLDGSCVISDVELDAIGTYDGATLTIARSGGANSDDLFSGGGIVAGQSSGNVTVGTYQYHNGLLTIEFNENSTKANVSTLFGSLNYKNGSDTPLSKIQIDWTFADGNIGAQGVGGSKAISGNTIFYIHSINDAPIIVSSSFGSVEENAATSTLIYTVQATDADTLMLLSYSISGTDASFLNIDSATGEVTLKSSANYEAKSSYNFNVIASDGSLSDTRNVIVGVNNVNEIYAGILVLSGLAQKGEMLTLSDTIIDPDGKNNVTYEWFADNQLISGASGTTYTLTEAEVGKVISVSLRYDGLSGSTEVIKSNSTPIVLDAILGTLANDTLRGTSKDDILNGGFGADTTIGGAGDDTYYVDNSGDTISEFLGGGIDTVMASLSYTLGNYIENLALNGNLNSNASGNVLSNVLTGNDGNNSIDGQKSADNMIGGLGNDNYYVDNSNDIITELSNGGIDTVYSKISYTLSDNIENLTLYSNASIDGIGNALDNILIGNRGYNVLNGSTGKDTLFGKDGKDILSGGEDSDLFVFDTALSANTNIDTITDFVSGIDKIQLSHDIFTSLNIGTLISDYFTTSTFGVAEDANDYLVYNGTNHTLFYDLDGNGSGAAVAIAILNTLVYSDVIIG